MSELNAQARIRLILGSQVIDAELMKDQIAELSKKLVEKDKEIEEMKGVKAKR